MNTLTISEVSNDRNGKVEPKSDDENSDECDYYDLNEYVESEFDYEDCDQDDDQSDHIDDCNEAYDAGDDNSNDDDTGDDHFDDCIKDYDTGDDQVDDCIKDNDTDDDNSDTYVNGDDAGDDHDVDDSQNDEPDNEGIYFIKCIMNRGPSIKTFLGYPFSPCLLKSISEHILFGIF